MGENRLHPPLAAVARLHKRVSRSDCRARRVASRGFVEDPLDPCTLRTSMFRRRIYISDQAIPPHKVTFNHTSSPSLSERKNHAIMGEVSYSPGKPAKPDAVLLKTTVDWLIGNRFIESSNDIAAQRVVDVRYGYPLPIHANPATLSQIMRYLEQLEIYTIGRFGSWSYANSDECIHQGMELARRLLQFVSDGKRTRRHQDHRSGWLHSYDASEEVHWSQRQEGCAWCASNRARNSDLY